MSDRISESMADELTILDWEKWKEGGDIIKAIYGTIDGHTDSAVTATPFRELSLRVTYLTNELCFRPFSGT